jgi:shikimate dehydrogenase
VVVNATPLGMHTGGTAPSPPPPALPLPVEALRAGQVVVDLIYQPATTPLLAGAAALSARTINGLGMLVHQAAHALRRWTGSEPPVEVMAQAVTTELARRGDEPAARGAGDHGGRHAGAT